MARGLDALPRVAFQTTPTHVEELVQLRRVLGRAPRLLIKRDDVIPFGFGGNKVRKLEYIAARALADHADTLITCGGIQSNHARATAAAAARLGMRAVLVLNGEPPAERRGNTLLDDLLGAEIHYVSTREDREWRMRAIADDLRQRGSRPCEIPLGASTPLGAVGFVRAVQEIVKQGIRPDAIVHASSTGGTQAGLIAGSALAKLETRVLGVSADDQADRIGTAVEGILQGLPELLGADVSSSLRGQDILVSDDQVGEGYGVPTPASIEATELVARHEGIFLDPTYTAKGMAGLIKLIRDEIFDESETVLFWHTGGLPGIFR
ncbi:MAG: 1-aminocyclopropane-1-carboxylate deaminase/D-cysteine desulfhydrase [Acidobacteriota bacterium]